ncbi:fucolectin-3-like [Haliotis asinina]|uniref:fucolectin-3-like n=1 Tax=Haliotis asinina TaxID=109174 RepID=UPI003531E94B
MSQKIMLSKVLRIVSVVLVFFGLCCLPTVSCVNLARNRPATQITQYQESYAQNAVDGSTASYVGYCSATAHGIPFESHLWWQVDLECSLQVMAVIITNRDSLGERLHDFDILISDDVTMEDRNVCHHYNGSAESGATLTVPCEEPLTGRYLRIQIPWVVSTDMLALCEVEVMGPANIMKFVQETATKVSADKTLLTMNSTKLQCADACRGRYDCVGFNFSPSSEECELLESYDPSDAVSNPHWVLHTADTGTNFCPCRED